MNKISNDIINVAILNSKILGEDYIEAYIPFVSTLISKIDILNTQRLIMDLLLKKIKQKKILVILLKKII